jgi:hypothetical protein
LIASEPEVIQDHIQRLGQLKLQRELWRPLWQDITDYVLPRRTFWDVDDSSGKTPSTKAYDGTAIASLQLLVDGMQGNMVSAAFPWLHMVMEDRRLQTIPGVADHLESIDEIILAVYQRTQFYESMNEFLMDLGSIGTAVMLVEDDVRNRSILFSTRHMKECYIAENRAGLVDVLYRGFTMTNRQIVETWPDKIDERRKELAASTPFSRGNIIHATFPSADQGFRTIEEPRGAYTDLYIDQDMQKLLDPGGYYETFPYLVGRWRKNSDEVYGRSPAADAIQDILRVNQMAKDLLHTGHMASDPPLMLPASLKGKERIVPHGFNYMASDEQIRTVDYSGSYPIGRDQQEAVEEQIKEIFRSKIFLLLQQLEHGPYTATEIRQRVAEQVAVLGATIGRFNNEVLVPLVRRTYGILRQTGTIPAPPPQLQGRMKVELQGPLAQAQRRTHQSQGVDAGMEFLERAVKLLPDGMDNVDQDEFYRIGLDAAGMPQRVIREIPMVEMVRKRRADALAKQQQAQAAAATDAQVMGNVDSLNQPVKSGSMLEQMAQQAAKARPAQKGAPQGAVQGAA